MGGSPLESERGRVRAAADTETDPATLALLAEDPSVLVRSAVALNPRAPGHANRHLTADGDERVRMVLARKLAAMLPTLSGAEQAALVEEAWGNLALLVKDEAERVRGLVADLLKEMPGVPKHLILELANDPCFSVSDPVLRLSPVLGPEDLLALIKKPPAPHTVSSIARRAELPAAVCDAIAESADTEAIQTLLENKSASLREAALDALVAQASRRVGWHEPIVRHTALSGQSARLMASFVTDRLLGVLAARTDLDAQVVVFLRERLEARGKLAEQDWAAAKPAGAEAWLTETALIEAIRRGDPRRVAAILATTAGVRLEAVESAARQRNARAAVSLLWRGGFTMRPAAAVQAMLFCLPPEDFLRALPDGGFPLSVEEMRTQMEVLARSAAAA